VGANGQLAFAVYGPPNGRGTFAAHAIKLLALDGAGQIASVASFHLPQAFARFGLPDQITS
jgi:hypothetical protein